MPHKYTTDDDRRLSRKNAQLVGEEMERLESSGLKVTPENLLQSARRKASPIHHLFEWDDKSAATQWRVTQARMFIRSVVVIVANVRKPVRAVFSIKTNGDREYLPRREVKSNARWRDQMSQQLFQRVVSATDEAEGLGLHRDDDFWKKMMKLRDAFVEVEA
jgi:hypothetical protein